MDSDDVDHLLREGRVRTRAFIAQIRVSDALAGGFHVLPTFSAPHHTIVAERAPEASLRRLLEMALQDVAQTPTIDRGRRNDERSRHRVRCPANR